MLGRYVPGRAQIRDLAAFSVHADAGELVGWLASARHAPRGVFTVHGEPAAAAALAARVDRELGWPIVAARDGEVIRL